MSDWLEHTVQIEVPVSIDTVWSLWSDLEQMPNWMKWISSVKVSAEDPEISDWMLASGAFEFKWKSKVIKQVTNQIIQWESVDGLPNRGAIRFYDRGDSGSIVKLTIGYGLPAMLKQVLETLNVGRIVESTLYADMERFRDYATKANGNVS
jgi:uncharacterized membrane protein